MDAFAATYGDAIVDVAADDAISTSAHCFRRCVRRTSPSRRKRHTTQRAREGTRLYEAMTNSGSLGISVFIAGSVITRARSSKRRGVILVHRGRKEHQKRSLVLLFADPLFVLRPPAHLRVR